MTRAAFERLVAEAVRLIPRRFRREMSNLVARGGRRAERRPARGDGDRAARLAVRPVSGDAADRAARRHTATFCPTITLFQRPIEEDCEDEEEIRDVIGETLIHEVGHYFGLSEEEIEEIEERYWRGERPRRGRRGRRASMTAPAGLPRARKRFGQHFLEPAWVARLLEVLAPDAADTFLEIGPGRGALTLPLAARAGRRRRRGDRPGPGREPRQPGAAARADRRGRLPATRRPAPPGGGDRAGPGGRRTCPTTSPRRFSSPSSTRRGEGRLLRDAHADGAARGGRPHRGAARATATMARWRSRWLAWRSRSVS